VAQFFGVPPMNFVAGEFSSDDNRHWLTGPGFRVAVAGAEALTGYEKIPRLVELGVRPENMSIGRCASEHHPIMGVVNLVERLGSKNIVSLDVGGKLIKVIVPPEDEYAERSQAWLGFAADPRHLLDPQTGRFFH
jgi:ABC-type sugar transport system ATPase subunit